MDLKDKLVPRLLVANPEPLTILIELQEEIQVLQIHELSLNLIKERAFIERLIPFSESNEWLRSSVQIFTDTDFMEVFQISPDKYKLYVWPWGEDNEKPFC